MRETVRTRVLLGLLLWSLLVAGAGAAPASAYEGVSVKHAHRHVVVAQRDLARAKAALRDARDVERATRLYSSRYGDVVGRWVWLADDVGWPDPERPTLFFVMDRESGGFEAIPNAAGSGALGLLQEMPDFYLWYGVPWYDRADARQNLRVGLIAWRHDRWGPWGM